MGLILGIAASGISVVRFSTLAELTGRKKAEETSSAEVEKSRVEKVFFGGGGGREGRFRGH